MKIAQIAPIIERVPPEKYGGIERIVYVLTEELVQRGHEVTLFASGDSITSAKHFAAYPRALRGGVGDDYYGKIMLSMLNLGAAYKMHEQFDIIHDHNDALSLAIAEMVETPVVITKHGAFSEEAKIVYKNFKRSFVVTISDFQKKAAPDANHIATIYNGLEMEEYPFSDNDDGYLLFVGRISKEKGLHHAINVAEALGLKLIIAAKADKADEEYFEKIKPRFKGNIEWIGEVDGKRRNELFSRAICSLHPVDWPEPFGLTLIEAMACGCPVIAFDRGSIPEIIQDKITGFVVKNEEEMAARVKDIRSISRERCRKYALENFNSKKMVDQYEKIYQEILSQQNER
ncbi:MAG: Glycosyltransferase [Parcubacteria group bacterium GW2011_GWE2_39_37]|nr:MAG: Glycosyltransferase [Parcubacteria group bacterium GW2011_GWE2_39_37]